MSANAGEPVFGSKPNLEVVSTASPCIASAVRVWTEGGVSGSVRASKRGKNAHSFSMEVDSLKIMSQASAGRDTIRTEFRGMGGMQATRSRP